MNTPLEDWPLTHDFDDLPGAGQQQVRETMGEDSYRAQRELHRQLSRPAAAPVEPLKATKEKLDAAFKARYTNLAGRNAVDLLPNHSSPAVHNAADASQNHSSPVAHNAADTSQNHRSPVARSQSSATAQRTSTRPTIFRWRTIQVAAASLVLLAMGYSLSFVFTPTPESTPAVREVIRYVDRPVREVEYRTVYVDRPVKVYVKLPAIDTLPVETDDNLAVNESQGVSLAGDTVMQALMVTLN